MFELETAADMSVEDNRADALHALDGCVNEEMAAEWAWKYGRHLCVADRHDVDLQDDLDRAENEANRFEIKADKYETALEMAVDALDRIDPDEMTKDGMREAITAATEAMEKALDE